VTSGAEAVATTTTSRSEVVLPRPGWHGSRASRGAWVLALTLLVAPGCRCADRPVPDLAASAAPAAPIPVPGGVLADLYVPRPEQVWARAQPGLTQVLGFRAPSFAALVVEVLGIPAGYAPGVVLERPITGVVIDADPPRWVLALPLRSGRELTAALTTGSNPTHRAGETGDPTVVLLERTGEAPSSPSLGVTGNSLLIATRSGDLEQFGPYAARGLGRRAMPTGPIELVMTQESLRRYLIPRLRARWLEERERLQALARSDRAQHGGRAPDFGDPGAVISALNAGIDRVLAGLGASRQIRLRVDLGPERLVFVGELEPEPEGPAQDLVAGLSVGDARALLALPAGAEVAATWRTHRAQRERAAATVVDGIGRLFGERLVAADHARLARWAADAARSVGDRAAIGWLDPPEGASVVAQLDVADGAAFDAVWPGIADLSKMDAIAAPVGALFGRPNVSFDRPTVAGIEGSASRARVRFTPPGTVGRKDAAAPLELWWRTNEDRSYLALGPLGSTALLRTIDADSTPGHALGADARAAAAVERAGGEIAGALLVAPRRLGIEAPPGGLALDPMVLTLGRSEGRLRLRGELDVTVVAGMVRRALARGGAP
jgi:hypothetical protein